MNTRIEKIIEDLIESVIQFDADIKKGNIEGLENFLNIFILKLKGFSYSMSSSKYEDVKHFLNFKDEISDVFNDLFTEKNILKIAGNLINQDSSVIGKIDALKHNGNPLNSKTFPDYRGLLITNKYMNPFHDFVSTYKGIISIDENKEEPQPFTIKAQIEHLQSKEEPQPDEAKKFNTTLTDPENLLVFPEKTLKAIHREFNGYLWESVDIDTLYNWFRQTPTGEIKLKEGKTKTGLCYFIGRIEDKKINVSNFGRWMSYHIGKSNYSRLKNEWQNNSTDSKEREEIDNLIKNLKL